MTLVHANFSQIGEVFAERSLPPADGVLADLGVSSMQLDLGERGFSFERAARWTCAWTATWKRRLRTL